MEKKTTLKDIAERASVSISTVSRVINGGASKVASPEVQEKSGKLSEKLITFLIVRLKL